MVHGVAYVLQMFPNVVQKLHMVFFSSTTIPPLFAFAHGATNVACGVFHLLWLVLALPYCASWSFIGGSNFLHL